MNAELMPVAFKGATLFLAEDHQEPYVPMKPVVEGMGLTWQPQHRKLTDNAGRWAKGIIMMMIPSVGGEQESICLSLKKLPGWLMSIDPNRVKPEIRQTVIDYQNECDDVLWHHWTNRQQHIEYNSESGFSKADFIGHEEGSLNPYVREYAAMHRFNMISGYDRMTANINANRFVRDAYGLDLAKLNNTVFESMVDKDHVDLATQRITKQKQPNHVKEFWNNFKELIKTNPEINHANKPDLIALNISDIRVMVNEGLLKLPIGFALPNSLRLSQNPQYIESNRVINSPHSAKSVRCWMFQSFE